ncbi:MAG: nucleotidyltransferase family protein [Hyphomicrobium sp.]
METRLAIDMLRRRADAFKAEGATALYLYGSRARGTHRPDSDLDIFVDYDPSQKFTLFDLAGIKILVEDLLTIEAHVTTRDSLHPELKPVIEREAIKVF